MKVIPETCNALDILTMRVSYEGIPETCNALDILTMRVSYEGYSRNM